MLKSKPARITASGSDLTRFPDCDGMADLVRTSDHGADRDSIGEAQQLVYDAWEETDRPRRHALARKALTLSPLCAEDSSFYSPGRENEASWYALELGFAWRKTPRAVEWLLDQMQHEPIQNRKGKTLH